MENDGRAAGPEIPEIKFSERVSRMHDEDGIQDATGVHEVVEDGAAEDLATREGDELYRTDDITYIRQETSTPQDDSTGYICVGLLNKSNKGQIVYTTKEEGRKFLEKMPKKGTCGFLLSNRCCKLLNGEYAEGINFKKLIDYTSTPTRRVSKCEDLLSKETFILKKIRKREWNKNEGIVPIQMNHRNIQNVVGFIQRNYPGDLMVELLLEDAGVDLDKFVREGLPLSRKLQQDISTQCLQGLVYLHLHDITHRDIKPSNFTINGQLKVTLIDFGSLRLPYEDVSVTGWTTEYLSPECAKYLLAKMRGKCDSALSSKITTKVDIFSLAMTMVFIVTGKHLLIGLVTRDFKYQEGQRDGLKNELMQQISEHPERIRDNVTRLIGNERLKKLLHRMSCADPEGRMSAKEALTYIDEMHKEEDEDQTVHSTSKLKLKGPHLYHPRIRTQETRHHEDDARETVGPETMQWQPQGSKSKRKCLPIEKSGEREAANRQHCDDILQTQILISDGSAAVPHKTAKFDEMTDGEDMSMAIAPYAQCIPVHAALEGEVGQPKTDSKEMHQQLKKKVFQRTRKKMAPSPPFNDNGLPSDLGCIPSDELIHMVEYSGETQATGNKENKEMNKQLLQNMPSDSRSVAADEHSVASNDITHMGDTQITSENTLDRLAEFAHWIENCGESELELSQNDSEKKRSVLPDTVVEEQDEDENGDYREPETSVATPSQPVVSKHIAESRPEQYRVISAAKWKQHDGLRQTQTVTLDTDGSAAVHPKAQKMEALAAEEDTPIALVPSGIPLHAATVGGECVHQGENQHVNVKQLLKAKVIQRRAQNRDPSPPCIENLQGSRGCIPIDGRIENNSGTTPAAGNNENPEMNNAIPRLNVLLSPDNFET